VSDEVEGTAENASCLDLRLEIERVNACRLVSTLMYSYALVETVVVAG